MMTERPRGPIARIGNLIQGWMAGWVRDREHRSPHAQTDRTQPTSAVSGVAAVWFAAKMYMSMKVSNTDSTCCSPQRRQRGGRPGVSGSSRLRCASWWRSTLT